MVVDSSAVVAILSDESERDKFTTLMSAARRRLMSAVTRVECTCVVEGRKHDVGRAELEDLLAEAEMEIIPVSLEQVEVACEGFRRYGKGRHPASLNIGDCFAYALAKVTGEPLLFKGEDFSRTDLTPAA